LTSHQLSKTWDLIYTSLHVIDEHNGQEAAPDTDATTGVSIL
jgi:hypothetical protein